MCEKYKIIMTKLYRFFKFSVSKSHLKFIFLSSYSIIFLFYKDPNVSLTHSLSHTLTQSLTPQKVSSNSTKIFLWVKLIDLITLLMFPTWNLTLGSEFLDFWWKILLTESCQEALLSTNPVCEVDYWVQNHVKMSKIEKVAQWVD